jgi:tRNA(Arg) A34 adenosine deaminase TadA
LLNDLLRSRLLDLSRHSDVASRHSAVIVRGGSKIVATGHNITRNCMSGHPICAQHAETNAILNLLSHYSCRSALQMSRDGKWCFLWGPTAKEKV